MNHPPLEILVNGEPRSLAPGSTLVDLVEALGLPERRLAVALNRRVVPRARYAEQGLASGDRVEIVEAVGGG